MKKKDKKNKVEFDFTVEALNYKQVCNLEHSQEFKKIMENPLEFARKLLKGSSMKPDNLCGNMFDPYIHSLVLREIANARTLIVDDYDPISRILASAACDIGKATRRYNMLLQDHENLLEEIEKFKKKKGEFDV